MSQGAVRTLPAPARSPAGVAAGIAVVAAGTGLLLMRTRLAVLPDAERVTLLALLYAVMLAGALAVPVIRDRARANPGLVLAAGLAAVGLAALASGRPAAAPFGAWVLPLSIVAAVAEEALFRRAAFGLLEPLGAPAAVLVTALLFAGIHLPLYGVSAFPVDLGAGLLFGWQRYASGTWTVPAGTHAAANLLAVILR
jgi:membrane protease YdiL (CAAX protease family)